MQSRDPALRAHLISRKPIIVHHLLWVSARHRASGAVERLGLWTGPDHQDFVIEGETRGYFGAGGMIGMEALTSAAGTDVRSTRLKLSGIAPEVEMAVRGYDARQAPVQIHRMVINPDTGLMLGAPVRRLDGWINKLEMVTADEGRDARCELTLVSNARAGTRALSLKKSDASQRLRVLPGGGEDRFYQYADVSGAVPVKWGTS